MPARRLSFALALLGAILLPLQAANVITFTAADLVLGQTLFTTNIYAPPANPATLNKPAAVAVDPTTGKVFVADHDNNRILRFASQTALKNGANAEAVFGQVNFSSVLANQDGGAQPAQTSLSGPSDIFVDEAGRLWVADTNNNRVLMFLAASSLFSAPIYADRVFGQPDFSTALPAPTASTLAGPMGVNVDSLGTLWVADTGSHRVVGFKKAANAVVNGPAADYLLGQISFTANTAATTQTNFFNPTGVSADSDGYLWVADRDNNRVVAFANPPLSFGPPAVALLGQKDYISNVASPSPTAETMNHPTGVFARGSRVWVLDDFNNRALRFDKPVTSTASPPPAAAVVGQSTFTAKLPGLSAQQIAPADGHLFVDATNQLWLADRPNNRVLRFPTTEVPPTVTVTGRKNITSKGARVTLKGTADDDTGIARVSYQIGKGQFRRAKGTTSWTATFNVPRGLSRITIQSVDLNGKASAPVIVRVTRK